MDVQLADALEMSGMTDLGRNNDVINGQLEWNDNHEGRGVSRLSGRSTSLKARGVVVRLPCHPRSVSLLMVSQRKLILSLAFLTGSASGGRPPSLSITVSGLVTHGPTVQSETLNINTRQSNSAPRVFSQSVVLIPDETVLEQEPKYYVATDSFRFVG